MHRVFNRLRCFIRAESGAVLVLAAFSVVGVLSATGLSIDVGRIIKERRDVQNAADAAAHAGATVLLKTGSHSTASATASFWVTKNVPTAASNVSSPPNAGGHSGNLDCVRARVTDVPDDLFVPGLDGTTVGASATACIIRAPKDYAVITLNQSDCESMEFQGSQTLTVHNGGTFTNSACETNAFDAQGASVTATAGHDVVGGWQVAGNASVNPEPTWAHPITDPLAGIPAPTPVNSPGRSCPNWKPDEDYTLQPGKYNCKIDPKNNSVVTFEAGSYYIRDGVSLNSGASVVFNPGMYVLGPSGFKVNGSANVTSTEATFYIQDGGSINMNGGGTINMTAPTSGTYAKILFFQSRTNANEVKLNGNAVQNGWGAVYAAAAQVTYTGNGTTSFQVICDNFAMSGNANLDITFNSGFVTQVPTVKLVE